MSSKLKALSLGIVAAFAMSAVVGMSASAETGGHFVSSTAHTTLVGADDPTDPTQFTGAATVECTEATYSGTTDQVTETEITITPTYHKCHTSIGSATVTMNGCHYLFTIGKKVEGHNTVHLNCPIGNPGPEIHVVTGCTITITPNQTPTGGVAYTTATHNGVHGITADVTVSGIHSVYHGGFFRCGVAEGATSNATMHGKATLEGRDTENQPVGITAT